MTPEMVSKIIDDLIAKMGKDEAIRYIGSAAYLRGVQDGIVQERERCARHCSDVYWDAMKVILKTPELSNFYEIGRASASDMCKAHILEASD